MKQLHSPTTLAIMILARELIPEGWDTTPSYEDANTPEKLITYYQKTGRHLVWSGNCEGTIYGLPVGNLAFRAVHDWIHLEYGLGFNVEDEEVVFAIQSLLIQDVCRRHKSLNGCADRINEVLAADLMGVIEFHQKNGYYPKRQIDFVKDYLLNPGAALNKEYERYEEAE